MKDLQYLTDDQGVATSVVIPIEAWKQLSKYYEQLQHLEHIGDSIRRSLEEVKEVKSGSKPKELAKDFLDGL